MTEKRNECCTNTAESTVVIADRWWAHIGPVPWATSRSTSLPVSVVANGVYCLKYFYSLTAPLLTLLPPLGAMRCLRVRKSISHDKMCQSQTQTPPTPKGVSHWLHGRRFSLAQRRQRCARSNLCAVPRRLGAMTQGVSFVENQKMQKV